MVRGSKQQMALRMLTDPDLTVRCGCRGDCQESDERLAESPARRSTLSKGNQPLRESARKAMVAVGPTSIPAAVKLLTDSDDQRQIDGSFILGQLRTVAIICKITSPF